MVGPMGRIWNNDATFQRWKKITEWPMVVVALMICGLGLLGTITATLASWFVEKVEETAGEKKNDDAQVS